MESKIISEDKFWKIIAKHRSTDNILTLECLGLTKDNEENYRRIDLDRKEQKQLFEFLEIIMKYYISSGVEK